jgi:hypothetical protein
VFGTVLYFLARRGQGKRRADGDSG